MSDLKSAWEIAQEKANRLGKLSAEEKEQQERQRYRQIGQALAQKWLDSSRRPNITEELNKYEEKEREIIKQALIEHLAEVIEPTTAQGINSTKKVIEALRGLGAELQPKAEQISRLVQDYEGAEQKMRQELESSHRETLHKLRISGTAIAAINIEVDPKWQPAHQDLVESFAPRLNELKQELTNH
jgi:valyl-tRNA synthetase